jgi:hypothetical protein
MRGVLVVALRELRERRSVFLAALGAGLPPFLGPLLPWATRQSPAEVRGVVALVLAVGFSGALAVAYGASAIAGELKESRLGFFFSRPLSGLEIWGGKALAGAVIVLVPAAVIALPTGLSLSGAKGLHVEPWLILAGAGGAVVLLALAHAAGVMVRSRSAWLAADLSLLVTLAVAGAIAWRAMGMQGAGTVAAAAAAVLGVVACLAVIVAGAVQVCVGRTDLRRGHRALSLTLWTAMTVAVGAFAAYANWVLAVTPDDLRCAGEVRLAPQGEWVGISALRTAAATTTSPS